MGAMTRDSPVLLAPAATAVANTLVGAPDAHTRLAPKNRPAQAPQGARLRIGCAPWAVKIVVLTRMELGMPTRPRMVMGAGVTYRDERAYGGGDRAGKEGEDGSEEGGGEGGTRLFLDVNMHSSPVLRAHVSQGAVYMQQRPASPYQQHEEGAHHQLEQAAASTTRRCTRAVRCLLTPIAHPPPPINGTVHAHARTSPRPRA
ncbi:hypothetical protein C8R44DRAFT_989628 [Mycena epipterygia]|nr:hypothetical protein C8R44DRAFT_989628 [Mycena epipterygia]